jgi:2-polyprenyl-6-methoxyphenol hydroxylase-like FAD-dependent oxidoreductase
MNGPIERRAVVIGAGMGGLVAAKAVAPFFEKVSVLERDALPARPVSRPGTPQDRHTHVLLAAGYAALARLFPNFERDLLDAGAVRTRLYRDVLFELGWDSFPRHDIDIEMFSQSRPRLEWICRRALGEDPNVEIVGRARVTEILASDDREAAIGVRFDDGREQRALAADLIIDASGRAAPTLAFLEAAGRRKPAETAIGVDMAYATAQFEPPRDRTFDWRILNHLPARPTFRRSGVVTPIEGGLWSVSLGGVHGDRPPGDLEGFLAFASKFQRPTIYDAIRSAQLHGDIALFNLPSSTLRHFDQVERFPRGLLPIGDSICRFNPVYGQGMTVAAQEAAALARLLEARRGRPDPLGDLAPAFFAEAGAALDTPWAVAASDFVYPETRGQRPPDFEGALMFQQGLIRLMLEDPQVLKLNVEVNHLLKPRSAFRDPELVQRVMARALAPAAA